MYVNKTEYTGPIFSNLANGMSVIAKYLSSSNKVEKVYEDNKLIYRSASVR